MSEDLVLELDYNIKEDKFTVTSTNMKDPTKHVNEWIRGQMGNGRDESKRNDHEVYKFKLGIDLSDDTYTMEHNCGNNGLREGILSHFVSTYEDDDE